MIEQLLNTSMIELIIAQEKSVTQNDGKKLSFKINRDLIESKYLEMLKMVGDVVKNSETGTMHLLKGSWQTKE